MAHFPVHAGLGLAIGLASQGSICPAAGYPLALWTHIPLDDLNTDNITVWHHGIGEGWSKWAYIVFLALASMAMVWLAIKLHLWWYVLAACLPDLEHPVRLLLKKQGYWLHNTEVMFWRPLRGQWGMLACVIVTVLLELIVWR